MTSNPSEHPNTEVELPAAAATTTGGDAKSTVDPDADFEVEELGGRQKDACILDEGCLECQ